MLIRQVVPIINKIYADLDSLRKPYVVFATQQYLLQSTVKRAAQYANMAWSKLP